MTMRGMWAMTATITLGLAACGRSDATPADDIAAVPVRVAAPTWSAEQPPIILTGVLGAKEEVPLGFKIGGVVATVAADVGQRVDEGQVLATLSLAEIEAQVAGAREARDKAQRDLRRADALYADSVATLAQVEDARAQLAVAEAQFRAAEFNRQHAEIRSPASGVVLRRQLEVGQMVGSGAPVFVVRTARHGLVLRAAAADRDAVRVTDGARATVRFDAFPGETFAARVTTVGVAASPMTGTYEVELTVDPARHTLASGLVGRAEVKVRDGASLARVPATALLEVDGDAATIFVLNADGRTARRVRVHVAFLTGDVAALAFGLPDSLAQVVIAGASRLKDGDRVNVIREATP